jgi:hypothetical protein
MSPLVFLFVVRMTCLSPDVFVFPFCLDYEKVMFLLSFLVLVKKM